MKTILVDAVDAFVIKTKNGFEVFADMHDLLENYPNRKILLTGADDEQFKKFGLDKMPYEVFTLKHNPEKNDPEYYKRMLSQFNLKPEEVIYFEHNPEAVKSAESVCIRTYYYDSDKQDIAKLKEFINKVFEADKVKYEWDMLKGTYGHLLSGGTGNRVLNNAILESFLIHVRIFHDFFCRVDPRDIIAEEFFDDPNDWRQETRINEQEFKDEFLPTVRDNIDKLHRHLAHLSKERTYEKKGWPIEIFFCECNQAWNKFLQAIPEEKQKDFIR